MATHVAPEESPAESECNLANVIKGDITSIWVAFANRCVESTLQWAINQGKKQESLTLLRGFWESQGRRRCQDSLSVTPLNPKWEYSDMAKFRTGKWLLAMFLTYHQKIKD